MSAVVSLADRRLLPVRPEVQTEHTKNMEKITINRDGLPPIAFTGEQIASADNRVGNDGNRANRWTEVSIYRTKGGKFIAALTRLTCWQGESDRCAAASFATAPEIIDWLK